MPFFTVTAVKTSNLTIGSKMAVRSASSTGYRLSKPQGLGQLEGLSKLIKFNYLIGSRTQVLLPIRTENFI
jgi:hypothetical protein